MLLYKLTVSSLEGKTGYKGWHHTFANNEELLYYIYEEKQIDIYIIHLEIIYEK